MIIKTILFFIFCVLSINASQVVFVSGGSKGIGFSTAELLSENGCIVYVAARTSGEVQENSKIHYIKMDVTDYLSVKQAVKEVIKREGKIDILINSAGYPLCGPLEYLTMKEVYDQMNVNFFGLIRVTDEVLPYMRSQKSGRIINVSSEQGTYGWPYGSIYTASKAALESLSEALSIEVKPWNIFVSIIQPGFVATDFNIVLGTKMVPGDPYKQVMKAIRESMNQKPEVSEGVQSSKDVAKVILKVVEEPKPLLRYQTSKQVEETVSHYINDLSGSVYQKLIGDEVQKIYFQGEN